MKKETQEWMGYFLDAVQSCFGGRLLCVGLQGSRARGEETPESDIDVVVILDRLDFCDLQAYDAAVSRLPHRDKLCGFVSGQAELAAWDKAELFQFVFDTKILYGSLDFITLGTEEDLRRAIHSGACGLYHACVHNILHEKSPELLRELYKSAFFVLQAKRYAETGQYISGKAEMRQLAEGLDRGIAEGPSGDFESSARRLMEWSGGLVRSKARP